MNRWRAHLKLLTRGCQLEEQQPSLVSHGHQDHGHGNVQHGKNPGTKSYLLQAEEKELSQFLVDI